MLLLVILLPLVARPSQASQELNTTEPIQDDPVTELPAVIVSEDVGDDVGNTTVAEEAIRPSRPAAPRQASRGPRLARRKPRRSRRFRPGDGPRYREPVNVYNPYYRVPQTYYDVYYNPYQGYYPEYAQPGYYPPYPYQPQQPYPQPYPYPPPPPVIPTPPPTLAPIPDLYYVQNTDGHYQYRRVSVTRRFYDSGRVGRPNREYRYPRRPGRPAEFRPLLRLTSAPYQAQVFGVTSPPPTETTGG